MTIDELKAWAADPAIDKLDPVVRREFKQGQLWQAPMGPGMFCRLQRYWNWLYKART